MKSFIIDFESWVIDAEDKEMATQTALDMLKNGEPVEIDKVTDYENE